MKKNFNKVIFLISLIFILILSLGLVSASNDSNDLIDITCNDNIIIENSISSDSDLSKEYDKEHLIATGDNHLSVVDNGGIDFNEENILNNGEKAILDSNSNKKVLNSNGENDFSDIQGLIDQSNENDTIFLDGKYCGDSKIVINKPLVIEGNSSATLDGGFITQIMEINSPNVMIKNLCFINSNGISLAINGKDVTIDNCSFENSINGELGSALSCYGDNVKILNSRFLNNIANKSSCHHTDGPAIYMIANNALIDGCTFINNTGYNYETASSGGAIWLKGSNCSLLNSAFINNSAISKFAWTLHSKEQTYLADGNGGAIFWVGNNGRIDNCSFFGSVSHTDGGALYFKAVNGFSISNSRFISNYAVGDAGAIYLGQNIYNMKIDNSSFKENVALGLRGIITQYNAYGGAIYSDEFTGNLSISNSDFTDNYGNASIYCLGSNLQVENSILDACNSTVENETLERFLSVIKDSTLENCTIKISDFSLYSYSESLFETLIFKDGSINNNYWGHNLKNAGEFIAMKLIKSNDEYISPNFWINLMIVNETGGNDNGSNQGNNGSDGKDADNNKSKDSNGTVARNKSIIVSKDMVTNTVYAAEGKIGKYFTFRLTDSNSKALAGKRVIVNFNGKDYYRTTDKNGYVKFQINLAKNGTYTIVTCFLGDDNYEAAFKSAKIKVNQVKPKIKVTNKRYKLSLKKKTLTAKLLSSRSKAVKGKKIVFRINGKTYSARTNSKGVATVKVTLKERKTYSFTAKFAGDNTFKAISVKRKVIVK